jgi:hypothetical protein
MRPCAAAYSTAPITPAPERVTLRFVVSLLTLSGHRMRLGSSPRHGPRAGHEPRAAPRVSYSPL